MLKAPLNEATAAQLEEKTEGWVDRPAPGRTVSP